MSPEPTTPVEEQTPAQTAENPPTPKEEKKEELMPKAELTRLLKKQAAEFTAKLKALEEKANKLDELEKSKLSEEEKREARLKKLEEEKAERTKELTGANLKIAKMEALLNAGAEPAQVSKLLKRVSGTTPEEIDADVAELKELGWIGQKPTTPDPKPQGLGTTTKTGDQPNTKTLQDQLNEANAKLRDPKISYSDKNALIDLTLRLNRKISKGET